MAKIPFGNSKKQKYIALFLGASFTQIQLGADNIIENEEIVVLGFPEGNTIQEVIEDYKAHLQNYYKPTDIPSIIQETALYPIGKFIYLSSHLKE